MINVVVFLYVRALSNYGLIGLQEASNICEAAHREHIMMYVVVGCVDPLGACFENQTWSHFVCLRI
jgi:hypothetical protein